MKYDFCMRFALTLNGICMRFVWNIGLYMSFVFLGPYPHCTPPPQFRPLFAIMKRFVMNSLGRTRHLPFGRPLLWLLWCFIQRFIRDASGQSRNEPHEQSLCQIEGLGRMHRVCTNCNSFEMLVAFDLTNDNLTNEVGRTWILQMKWDAWVKMKCT